VEPGASGGDGFGEETSKGEAMGKDLIMQKKVRWGFRRKGARATGGDN
jgi:hypothetical protein